MAKNKCEFNEGGICHNDDMNSGEECMFTEEECPKSFIFREEDY